MKFKTFVISYWGIVMAFFVGVIIQRDSTSLSDAMTWLAIASVIFGVALYLQYRSNKKKKQRNESNYR